MSKKSENKTPQNSERPEQDGVNSKGLIRFNDNRPEATQLLQIQGMTNKFVSESMWAP